MGKADRIFWVSAIILAVLGGLSWLGSGEIHTEAIFLIAFALLAYLAPSIIASSRHHTNSAAIMALNIIFGWTLIGWGAALVWSLTNNTKRSPHPVG